MVTHRAGCGGSHAMTWSLPIMVLRPSVMIDLAVIQPEDAVPKLSIITSAQFVASQTSARRY